MLQELYQTQPLLNYHRMRTGENSYQSKELGKSFNHSSIFIHYPRIHNGANFTNFKTDRICKNGSTLLHIREVILESNDTCKNCGKAFEQWKP